MTRADVLRLSAPFIAMGGVWVTQKALTSGYRAATGTTPPTPDDLEAPIARVLLYATAGAMVAAIVNTVVTRQVARASAKAEARAELPAV